MKNLAHHLITPNGLKSSVEYGSIQWFFFFFIRGKNVTSCPVGTGVGIYLFYWS